MNESAEVEPRASSDPAFITPKKPKATHDPAAYYLAPYFSSKLKDVASKIRSNAKKRFRMREERGEMRLVFWSELKPICSPASTHESYKSSTTDLSAEEIDQLVRRNRIDMMKTQNGNTQKRKKVDELLKMVSQRVEDNKILKLQLKSLRKLNKQTELLTFYSIYLRSNDNELASYASRMKVGIDRAIETKDRIINCIDQIPVIDALITDRTAECQRIISEQSAHSERLGMINEALVPRSMINCMFLVGILNEQTYILVLQRKERLKQTQAHEKNRSSRISQKLIRRELHIECQNSLTVELNTLISIYMHCKSLTICNVVSLMNSLSFFAQEFKQFYDFSVFETYIRNFIDLTVKNQRRKLDCEYSEAQTLKKRLIILVRQAHELHLRQIMQIFKGDSSEYFIQVGSMRMMIEIAVDDPSHCAEQRQWAGLQHNELQIHFDNLGDD